MKHFTLSAAQWTLIVPPDGPDDADIRPLQGAFLTSLNVPSPIGATTLSISPVSAQEWAWARREVMAGVPVYARAIGGPAAVLVGAVSR